MVRARVGQSPTHQAFPSPTVAPVQYELSPGVHAADWALFGCSDWSDLCSDWLVATLIGHLLKSVSVCIVPPVTPHPCICPMVFCFCLMVGSMMGR